MILQEVTSLVSDQQKNPNSDQKTLLLSIVGSTATGKTDLALWLCQQLEGKYTGFDLISADSRQVYKGLEIISGTDIPAGFENKGDFFEKAQVQLHGISMLSASAEWSVAQFQDFAQKIVAESWARGRLPIIVGGTGLYHQQLWQSDPQLHVTPNLEVREKAQDLSVVELQAWLRQVSVEAMATMNHSDSLNPRRLVRKIELELARKVELAPENAALGKKDSEFENVAALTRLVTSNPAVDEHMVGLSADLAVLEEKIRTRIENRLQQGALSELERLVADYPDSRLPIYSSTGVKPLLAVLNGELELEQAKELWFLQERSYAKRQITWWKKRTDVKWFSVADADWQQQVLEWFIYDAHV